MKQWLGVSTIFGVLFIGMMMVLPIGQAADMTKDLAIKYILPCPRAGWTSWPNGLHTSARRIWITSWADCARQGWNEERRSPVP